ncbi:MAG: ABC transporter permease subunit [Clostridia bacterium]|nr:ABC transporter permease subunit [Clostridia bacterium]
MTIFLHELRSSRLSLIIWSAAISFMLGVCVFIYPEMSGQMSEIGDMFSEMGAFSSAFGMDQLNFGEFIGYFGIECGNVLGIGGVLFAAITGVSMLAKEEKEHTAEFLLTHPVTRTRAVTEKLIAALAQVVILNIAVIAVTAISIALVDVEVDAGKLALIFLAYFIMQLEILCITFGISAFIRRGGLGIGLGLAIVTYFVNIIANLTEDLEFLKYITPFGYTDSADIVSSGELNLGYLAVGVVFLTAGIVAAYVQYNKKDIL